MEGPIGPNVYEHLLTSPISNIDKNKTPTTNGIKESNNTNHTNCQSTLSKIYSNTDSENITIRDKEYPYDEIDDIKFNLELQSKPRVETRPKTLNKSTSVKRSSISFLSNLFHRKSSRSNNSLPTCSADSDQHQVRDMAPSDSRKGSVPSALLQAMSGLLAPTPPATSGPSSPVVDTATPLEKQLVARPYHWPHDNSLEKKSTALVIIDMQKDFASDKGYLAKQGIDNKPILDVVPKVQKLLMTFREAGYPIYHTREGHRPDLSTLSAREKFRSRNNNSGLGIGDQGPLGRLLIRGEKGHEIIDELTPLDNEQVIDKPGRSAFQHTEFRLMLNIAGIKNLVICGVTTDVCVTSTMREANDNNFDCVLVEDACAAGVGELHTSAVESITEEGGIFGAVTTTDNVIAKLSSQPESTGSSQAITARDESIERLFEPEPSPTLDGASSTIDLSPGLSSDIRPRGRRNGSSSVLNDSGSVSPTTIVPTTGGIETVEKITVTSFIDDGTSAPLLYAHNRAPSDPLFMRKRRDSSQSLKRGTRGVAYNIQKSGKDPVATRFGTSKLVLNVSSSESEDEDDDAGVGLGENLSPNAREREQNESESDGLFVSEEENDAYVEKEKEMMKEKQEKGKVAKAVLQSAHGNNSMTELSTAKKARDRDGAGRGLRSATSASSVPEAIGIGMAGLRVRESSARKGEEKVNRNGNKGVGGLGNNNGDNGGGSVGVVPVARRTRSRSGKENLGLGIGGGGMNGALGEEGMGKKDGMVVAEKAGKQGQGQKGNAGRDRSGSGSGETRRWGFKSGRLSFSG